jgi:hypothetical protein
MEVSRFLQQPLKRIHSPIFNEIIMFLLQRFYLPMLIVPR